VADGVEYRKWTYEDVVDETDRYYREKDEAQFAAAFQSAGM